MRRFARAAVFLFATTFAMHGVRADDGLAAAKELFKDGVRFYEAGDYTQALDRFTRSRASFASSQNTLNSALCLDRLGRFDEALEMFDDLVARFDGDLDANDKALVVNAIASLRAKVGSVDVTSNVDGRVAVDGRDRGALPVTLPIRALAGTRRVRVTRDGYATFEATVEVKPGETTKLDARLEPLSGAGELRVESDADDALDVVVDRRVVGKTPWQGAIPPGAHAVWIASGDRGTAPAKAVVVQGQTTLVRLRAAPLATTARINVVPASAELSIAGVALGHGTWEGRLPAGTFAVTVEETGYFTAHRTLVAGGGASSARLDVKLDVDPDHPRWPRPPIYDKRARFFAGAFAGYPTGRITAVDQCGAFDSCSSSQDGAAALVGARAGAHVGALSIDANLVYLTTGWASVDATKNNSASYRGQGLLIGPGLAYRIPLPGGVGVIPRFTIGDAYVWASFRTNGGAPGSTSTRMLFVAPELGADVALGRFRLALACMVLVLDVGVQAMPLVSIERTF